MTTAVIYARYSSDRQREASIDDQVRVCTEHCQREGIDVVGVYADYAISGKRDDRPQFRAMIDNAPESDYVIVYSMDRFSRDAYDPAIFKKELARKGVRVISATEYIPPTAEGIFMEKMLEGQAAYYSLKLSKDVKRGMEHNAMDALYNGVRIFGYKRDEATNKYAIDDDEAAIVREVFARYNAGEAVASIVRWLHSRGVESSRGKVSKNWVWRMLKKRAYIGVYEWGDHVIEGGMPRIVSDEDFAKAQRPTGKRPRAMEDRCDYPLTAKGRCMVCGETLAGKSAHGKSGRKYRYYACRCRKPVRADKLEEAISDAVIDMISDESKAREIAHTVAKCAPDGKAAVKAATDALKANRRALDNIADAIAEGTPWSVLKGKCDALEADRVILEANLEKAKRLPQGIDEADLADFLMRGIPRDQSVILSVFVNQVFLHDGYAVATLMFRKEDCPPDEVVLEEVEARMEELGLFENETPAEGEGVRLVASGGQVGTLAEHFAIAGGVALVVRLAA